MTRTADTPSRRLRAHKSAEREQPSQSMTTTPTFTAVGRNQVSGSIPMSKGGSIVVSAEGGGDPVAGFDSESPPARFANRACAESSRRTTMAGIVSWHRDRFYAESDHSKAGRVSRFRPGEHVSTLHQTTGRPDGTLI